MTMNPRELRTARECIAEQLRDEIISGRIPAGTLIRQEGVSEQMGVSRTPVREAFQLLEMEGLVEKLITRHIRVIGVSKENYAQLLRMARDLELCALDMLRTLPGFQWRRMEEDALAPHQRIVEGLNNQIITVTLGRLLYRYIRLARIHDTAADLQAQSNCALNDALAHQNWADAAEAVKAFYAVYEDGPKHEA